MSELAYLNIYTREAMAKTLVLRDEKIERIEKENAKLRELLQDAWSILVLTGNDDVVAVVSKSGATMWTIDADEISKAVKELGLEVQPWAT